MGSLAPIKPQSELRDGAAIAPVVIYSSLRVLGAENYGAFCSKRPEIARRGFNLGKRPAPGGAAYRASLLGALAIMTHIAAVMLDIPLVAATVRPVMLNVAFVFGYIAIVRTKIGPAMLYVFLVGRDLSF